jgi:hypothetical protein
VVYSGCCSRHVVAEAAFVLALIDLLTRRVLLAAGRTGTGGDALFVRDLFGWRRRGSRSAGATTTCNCATWNGEIMCDYQAAIKCRQEIRRVSSRFGDCEPLIQVRFHDGDYLQEVRKVR